MILSDGGFHKRACFIAPDLQAANHMENCFNSRISSARCIVENAFGLLKMKWRRLHQHSIAECTRVVPQLILCACVLHNICIDAGDVNDEENAAVRDAAEAAADRVEINAACDRILGNNGNIFHFNSLFDLFYLNSLFIRRCQFFSQRPISCQRISEQVASNVQYVGEF